MSVLVPTPFGLKRSAAVRAADHLLELKRKALKREGNGIWDVISEIVNIWQKQHPSEWKSYLFDLGKIKATRRDKEFASGAYGIHSSRGVLRYTIDMPQAIYLMIRSLYNPDELPMNREFFLEFGKRFPLFRVPERM